MREVSTRQLAHTGVEVIHFKLCRLPLLLSSLSWGPSVGLLSADCSSIRMPLGPKARPSRKDYARNGLRLALDSANPSRSTGVRKIHEEMSSNALGGIRKSVKMRI